MDTNTNKSKSNLSFIFFIIFALYLLGGCSYENYEKNTKLYNNQPSHLNNNTDYIENKEINKEYGIYSQLSCETLYIEKETQINEIYYPFFGIWHLEELAFSYQIFSGRNEFVFDRHTINQNIEKFIGYELELRADFIRLGNTKINNPYYSNTDDMDIGMHFMTWYSSNGKEWFAGTYSSPKELFREFQNRGLNFGTVPNKSIRGYEDIWVAPIFISYPSYPTLDFRSECFDPNKFGYDVTYNPIFRRFIILNYNYILLGGNRMILARRISE
jgi:hypothetical protein